MVGGNGSHELRAPAMAGRAGMERLGERRDEPVKRPAWDRPWIGPPIDKR